MRLHKLSLADKKLFTRYLSLDKHELSVYAFQNIYIWKGLFDIKWQLINGSLCVFFRDQIGMFMYHPPLGKNISADVVEKCFQVMDSFNANKEISRIENITEKDLTFYRSLGLSCRIKSYDYLCPREALAGLKGNKFKSKRASYNYFIKHYAYQCLSFTIKDRLGCLALYNLWSRQRKEASCDRIYQGMLDDSLISLKALFKSCRGLDIQGIVVKIGREVKGFTLGFRLNKNTFCILYEITDLSIKGLAQFIFREFCRGLAGYKYINIMDDSGLENLKKVKFSYHPEKLIPAYIAIRKEQRGTGTRLDSQTVPD